MELNSIEKVCSEISHEEKYYAFNRVSAYDPNMCSTARFSPPYSSDNVPEAQDADTYENVILIPCTTSESEATCIGRTSMNTNEIACTYTAADSNRHYSTEYISSQPEYPSEQNTAQDPHAKHLEPQITQIVLRQSPNGTLYQNYYVTNNVKVELIPSSSSSYRTHYVPLKENDSMNQAAGFGYNSKMSQSGEMLEHLEEANFVQLNHELMPEQGQEEFLAATYNSIPSSNTSLALHEKDQQRLLLESTMSPLLAAVNDITQRDAELQSYLNQSLSKASQLEVFNRDGSQEKERSHFIHVNHETVAEKDCRLLTQNFQEIENEEDCFLVTDKPVESRAKASLPTNYLYFNKSSDQSTDASIYAKREIPLRTKFGPFEGEMRMSSEVISDVLIIQATNTYPLLLVQDTNILDVSNENSCNWMRFVRMAKNFTEQNLLLIEESGRLYFRSCRVIRPKQELRVGYSDAYAKHYDLKIISPTQLELREEFNHDHPWPCFECDERFATSNDLQNHLVVHDVDEVTVKARVPRKKRKMRSKHFVDIKKSSIRCLYCNKVFMTNSSLKKHVSSHFTGRRSLGSRSGDFRCGTCYKKFMTEEKLKIHRLVHVKNDIKPYKCSHCNRYCSTPTALSAHMTSHSLRYFSCVFCSEKFTNVNDFRTHIRTHSVNGTYTCQWCKKKYSEYHLVRKHVRIFHQSFKLSCDECGRKFANVTFLKRHKLCHSDKCEYLCSQCGKQFKRKDKLREHIQRVHSEKRKQRTSKKSANSNSSVMPPHESDHSNNKYHRDRTANNISGPLIGSLISKTLEDYRNFMYKCDDCMLGFKRRGMLVNHMVKRHPEVPIDSIPELNLPILRPQSLFYCQYCSKVYRSNAKRKLHILKNHPGEELPPSARTVTEPSQINARTVGNLPTEPHRCHWCYKQYAARNRLVAHHRKAHPNLEFVSNNSSLLDQSRDYIETLPSTLHCESAQAAPTLDQPLDVYRPPCSPENKLLKLSSAALELSSIEDRKFFDFLNEKSQCSLQEQNSLPDNHHDNLNLVDNGNAFSKVDVNFKVVDSEFGESSSNGELNRLPQLFEESIACI